MWTCSGNLRFPLIVIPECETISEVFRDDLLEYVRGGGSLLVVGKTMTEFFSSALRQAQGPVGEPVEPQGWVSVPFGAGKIGFIPEEIAGEYESRGGAEDIRAKVNVFVNELFPEPQVRVVSSPYVDVSLRKLNGKLQVHLVNTSGDHRNTAIIESIDPVKDIEVSVSCTEKPSRIVCQPDGKELRFKYKDGKATFKLPVLEIYDIIEIE